MDSISVRIFAGFGLLDGLFWAYYAAFLGYITTYMLDCGLSSSILSIVLAVFMGMAFLGAFFWGGKCDKAQTNKKIFIPEFIGAVCVSMVIFFLSKKSILAAACLYPLLGFLIAPLGSNLDTWMLRSFHGSAAVYGRARSIGSAGFAVMMLVSGNLIAKYGYNVMPVSSLIIAALVLALAFIMPEEKFTGVRAARGAQHSRKELFTIRPYVFLLIILFLTGLSVSPINNLKIVILQSVGGDVSSLGMDSFIGVMVQALFIFISGNLRRIPAYIRLFLMALCVMIMMILTITAVNPMMITIGTIMNNMSYGLLLPTMREITENSVQGDQRNTAHSLCDAMFGSFAGIIALLYSGFLMDTFGARSVAVLGAGIMVIPLAMSFITLVRSFRENIAQS